LELELSYESERLRREVTAKLRLHAYIDDQSARHVLQYLILPSFEPCVAWDVFRQRSEGHPDRHILLRSSWRSDLDEEKLDTPAERLRHPYPLVPTVEIHELPVPSEELERLANELAAVMLPLGASTAVLGMDGTSFEVAIEQESRSFASVAKCRLSWWHEPPSEWSELGAWARRVESVFESAWSGGGNARTIPVHIPVIDDAAGRHEAQRAFHSGLYGRAAELLADIGTREKLTAAEEKMLEIALRRAGAPVPES